jgi:hypothetical protein
LPFNRFNHDRRISNNKAFSRTYSGIFRKQRISYHNGPTHKAERRDSHGAPDQQGDTDRKECDKDAMEANQWPQRVAFYSSYVRVPTWQTGVHQFRWRAKRTLLVLSFKARKDLQELSAYKIGTSHNEEWYSLRSKIVGPFPFGYQSFECHFQAFLCSV